jgi:choline dehydrogenase-like flavoprotein
VFDYIVVGAGTAGCTLAALLTGDSQTNVLLIEAGPPNRRRDVRVPSAFPKLLGSDVDWNDVTVPQEQLGGRRPAWPRGKLLGGSGSIGAMMDVRGCRADYDAWLDAGNPGWGYDDLTWPDSSSEPSSSELTERFLAACARCAIPRYTAFEGPAQAGAGLVPVARRAGARWSAAESYLRPALRRGNLTVWTRIQVVRVLIEDGRATGVEYLQRGSLRQVTAAKEVILCAGAVGSAHLLLLSGVGPPRQLEPLGIPVAAPLEGVGRNLQDHLGVELSYGLAGSTAGPASWLNRLRYRIGRQGPLKSNLLEAVAYVKSRPDLPACDLGILFAPVRSLDRGLEPPVEAGFSLFPTLLAPRSRGQLTLASPDPLVAPSIDPAYLAGTEAEAEDWERLTEGVKLARRVAASEPLAGENREPEESAEEAIESHARSLWSPVGTCKMGPGPDCVVDSALQVHGIAGLRVVDASVMPVIPRAPVNATVTAIAATAARRIREGRAEAPRQP